MYREHTRIQKINDENLNTMSARQQKLRMEIEACKDTEQITKLKKDNTQGVDKGSSEEKRKRN